MPSVSFSTRIVTSAAAIGAAAYQNDPVAVIREAASASGSVPNRAASG